MIDDLVGTGFERPKQVKAASLEDVFIHLTGREMRDE
jgi:ABC-2 type transport system ATP-binding protein